MIKFEPANLMEATRPTPAQTRPPAGEDEPMSFDDVFNRADDKAEREEAEPSTQSPADKTDNDAAVPQENGQDQEDQRPEIVPSASPEHPAPQAEEQAEGDVDPDAEVVAHDLSEWFVNAAGTDRQAPTAGKVVPDGSLSGLNAPVTHVVDHAAPPSSQLPVAQNSPNVDDAKTGTADSIPPASTTTQQQATGGSTDNQSGTQPQAGGQSTPASAPAGVTPSASSGFSVDVFPPSATSTSSSESATAPPPASARATQPSPVEGQDRSDRLNEARLARGLSSALNQKGGAVTLRLTPAELGTVRIHLQLNGNGVRVQFQAETADARGLIQQQMTSLRVALEGQGLSVDRLSVQSGGSSTGGQFNQHGDSSSSEGRSRGQYAQDQSNGRNDREGSPGRDFAQWIETEDADAAFALTTQE